MKNIMSNSYILLLLSALLAALPMTFPSLFLLSWVAFVPFFLVILKIKKSSLMRSAFKGIFFGFLYHAFVYFWFLWMYPLDFAGLSNGESLFVVLLAWLGISLLHGVLFAIPTGLCRLVSKKIQSPAFLLFAAVFGVLLSEHITEYSALAFPWVRISLGQYRAPVLIQSASVWGIEGVDFLILLVSALLALGLVSALATRKVLIVSACALFTLNLLFGVVALTWNERGKELTVTSVQGCILAGEQWSGNSSALETYSDLTKEKSDENAKLVVWPEGAVPINLYSSKTLQDHYKELSAEIDTPILMGCFWKEAGKSSNSAVLVDENGISNAYTKRHLVPFGEYLPYREILSQLVPVLSEINVLSEDLAQGEDSGILETEDGKIGTVICFESVFPSLARESVLDGAQLLVVITNDGWYKDSPAVWQHLAHAVFRSVENSRATVRCASSGVSAFIDGKGRVQSELGPLKRGTLTDTVTFSDSVTVYTAMGRVLLPVLSASFLISFAVLLFLERRQKNGR